MSIIDGYVAPWVEQGISKFDWGVKQRQQRAEKRFADGGPDETKFAESQEMYWQKRCFVDAVFERTRWFLQLKESNSVAILFKIGLKGDLADTFPLPSPALVRVRIARIAGQGQEPRCQWQAADCVGEQSSANDNLDAISSCFSGARFNRISGFLQLHFGVNLAPHTSNYPDVSKIEARVILRDPLGVLAVVEGDSLKISYDDKAHFIDSSRCLSYLRDDPLLSEV